MEALTYALARVAQSMVLLISHSYDWRAPEKESSYSRAVRNAVLRLSTLGEYEAWPVIQLNPLDNKTAGRCVTHLPAVLNS